MHLVDDVVRHVASAEFRDPPPNALLALVGPHREVDVLEPGVVGLRESLPALDRLGVQVRVIDDDVESLSQHLGGLTLLDLGDHLLLRKGEP